MDAPLGSWQRVWRKSLTAIGQGCYDQYKTNPGSNIPQNSNSTATNHPSRRPSKLDEQDIQYTAGGARKNSKATFSNGPLHTDAQVKDNQLELIYNSSVRTQDVAWKTCQKRWIIDTDGKRELGKSVWAIWHDNDDIYIYIYIYIIIMTYCSHNLYIT